MPAEILKYYAVTNTPYLHAYAEAGTEFLLKELKPGAGERILEVGFGTGGTLVKIRARWPQVQLFGIDRSAVMLGKATARLRFCGISRDVCLQLMGRDNRVPFEDNVFDKVYVESVLGIQEDGQTERILAELRRVLKSGGALVLNETVWLPETTPAEIEEINNAAKQAFGIIQANADYPTRHDWVRLLQNIGFAKVVCMDVVPVDRVKPRNIAEWLSKLFTFFGRVRGRTTSLQAELKRYKKEMHADVPVKRYMEGVLFVGVK